MPNSRSFLNHRHLIIIFCSTETGQKNYSVFSTPPYTLTFLSVPHFLLPPRHSPELRCSDLVMGSAVFGVHLNEEDDEIREKYATVVRAGSRGAGCAQNKRVFLAQTHTK